MLDFFTCFRIVDQTNNAIKRLETSLQYIDAVTQCFAPACGRDNLIRRCSRRHLNNIDLNGVGRWMGGLGRSFQQLNYGPHRLPFYFYSANVPGVWPPGWRPAVVAVRPPAP